MPSRSKQDNAFQRKVSFSIAQILTSALVFGLIGGYTIFHSFAAKALPATLSVLPNPTTVANASQETFGGCGYQPSLGITIVVYGPTAVSSFGGLSDASGCINLVHSGIVTTPGTYSIAAWQDSSHGKNKSVQMSAATFIVN